MSQRRASRRAARVRWREQAARLVVTALWPGASEPGRRAHAGRYSAGSVTFDVALVRAYCERLVAEGERLAAERDVFADWTRTRGKGPECRDTFGDGECGHCLGSGKEGFGRQGRRLFNGGPCKPCKGSGRVHAGWPGPLAREYGWERCESCEGKGAEVVGERVPCGPGDGYVWHVHSRTRCSVCKGRGRTRKHGVPAGFANGDAIARTARRLLDTLDGRCPWAPSAKAQALTCLTCRGLGALTHRTLTASPVRRPCDDCHGTGHNLSGVLPEVEHPAPRVSEAILTPGAVRAARAATRARHINEIAALAVRAIRGGAGG
jgi:hypothetical protein